MELYDFHQAKIAECDAEIETTLRQLSETRPAPRAPLPAVRHAKGKHELTFDARAALYALLGADLTQIHGFGPYTVLRLVAECGDDMSKWPTAKHFTSWLGLAPGNKVSGGRLLSSKTRRSANAAGHGDLGEVYLRTAANHERCAERLGAQSDARIDARP